jgi:ribosomal protein S18 acetylase RimI-like enzyme
MSGRLAGAALCDDAWVADHVELRPGTVADLPALEPLWVSVHHQHARSMPELAPYVDDKQTWAARSQLYRELLGKPGTILLLADAPDGLAGYGLAHVRAAADTWTADTWQTGALIGEIESLGVRPGYRGQGIGSRLLGELISQLAAAGVHDLVLGVLPGNTAAILLYQRYGFRPTWSYLSRFTGR